MALFHEQGKAVGFIACIQDQARLVNPNEGPSDQRVLPRKALHLEPSRIALTHTRSRGRLCLPWLRKDDTSLSMAESSKANQPSLLIGCGYIPSGEYPRMQLHKGTRLVASMKVTEAKLCPKSSCRTRPILRMPYH